MKFTLHIRVGNPTEDIKERIMEEVASYLSRNGYSFDVGFAPNEFDIDKLGKS